MLFCFCGCGPVIGLKIRRNKWMCLSAWRSRTQDVVMALVRRWKSDLRFFCDWTGSKTPPETSEAAGNGRDRQQAEMSSGCWWLREANADRKLHISLRSASHQISSGSVCNLYPLFSSPARRFRLRPAEVLHRWHRQRPYSLEQRRSVFGFW